MKKNDHILHALHTLGLSDNEAELYILMLKKPKSTVQEMATWSPFSRTMLYHVLNQLAQKGLVSSQKDDWKTVYIAENPQQLYQLLSDKEEHFATEKKALQQLIPQLKNSFRLAGKRPDLHRFEGLKEYKRVLEDIVISQPDIVFAYSTPSNTNQPGIEFRETADRKRIARGIPKHTLLFPSAAAEKQLKKTPYHDLNQYRFIQKETTPFTVDFQLYAGKILYTTYVDREPITILLEDQLLHDMQKSLFLSLWDQAQPASLLAYDKT